MTIKLYHNPVSTCSQKVRITLAEKDVDYEEQIIDWGKLEHLSDWYLKINPNGVVPAITHDGQAIIDSSVICEYLDEVFPQSPLTPKDPIGRAKMRAWMRYLEEVPTAAIRIPSFNMRFKTVIQSLDSEVFEKMPLRKQLYKEMGEDGFSDEKFDSSIERLRKCLERVSNALEEGPWLIGEQFSIADILLIPTVIRMVDLKLDHVWDDLPNVQNWLDRVMARPSFERAYYDGSRMPG